MSAPTPFTTLALSVGPVDVYLKDAYALDLLLRLQLEVLNRRHELDRHNNNALLREVCPVLAPVTALMLVILSHPAAESPVVEREGEIVEVVTPSEFEPVTIGDLLAVIGVTGAQRHMAASPPVRLFSAHLGGAH
ncbi:hypothetical protein [Gemmatimonas sp.]